MLRFGNDVLMDHLEFILVRFGIGVSRIILGKVKPQGVDDDHDSSGKAPRHPARIQMPSGGGGVEAGAGAAELQPHQQEAAEEEAEAGAEEQAGPAEGQHRGQAGHGGDGGPHGLSVSLSLSLRRAARRPLQSDGAIRIFPQTVAKVKDGHPPPCTLR